MKVIIIGAGPAGLTAGVELARQGVEVEILDKRASNSTLSRAIGINPHSLKLLEPSGVTNELLKAGIKYKQAHFHQGAKPWVKLSFDIAKPKRYGYTYMLGLPQDKTEALLRAALKRYKGKIHYSTELVSIRESKNQVTAIDAEGKTFTGDYLIGADGVNSTTRKLLGIQTHAKTLDEPWSIADVDAKDLKLEQSVALYLLKNGQMAFIAPIGKTRFRVVSSTADALEALPIKIKITKKRREGQFRIHIFQVESYGRDRVFLAGDAAHSHSPVGGRGMNLGISDACDLAQRIISGKLKGYNDARQKEGHRIIHGSEVLRKLLSTHNPIKRFLVMMMVKTIALIPPLQKRFASRFLYG